MLITRNVTVENAEYEVVISDDSMALSAAYAAGRAIIGIWKETGRRENEDFSFCLYFVTDPSDVDRVMLERVVRRRINIPWKIGETKRLLIREFAKDDPLENAAHGNGIPGKDGAVFCDREARNAYIEGQYRFHECGLWAVFHKETGALIGKAGITGGELGYHIYPAYRHRGYAFEACEAILEYGKKELSLAEIMLRAERDNRASVCLAVRLGFEPAGEENGLLLYKKEF